MKPLRPPSSMLFMVLALLAVLTQKTRQQSEPKSGTNGCIATRTPVEGEPAQVRCVFPINVTDAIPVDITIERYQWFGDTRTVDVLSCTLTKISDKDCKVLMPGYTSPEPSGNQVQLLVTTMSQRQAGLYACKMMTKSLPEPFQQTCELILSDTPKRPTTILPDVTVTHANEAAQESSVPNGIIVGAVVAVAVLIAVALLVLFLIRRSRRNRARARAKEEKIAEDWISEDEEESISCCDKLRHWHCGCQRRGEPNGDAEASKENSVNDGLVKKRAEKFGGSASVRSETKKPLMKKSSENEYAEPNSIGNGKKVSKKETVKPIYTKPLKKPLLENEQNCKNELPLKPTRSNSQEKKPQGGGAKTNEKPSSPADEKPDPNAPYKPVQFADSPAEFVEIFMEAKTKLKPVPESEAPEAKTSGAAAPKKKRAPDAIEFENAIKEQKEKLATKAEKIPKEKTESEAKEYEKELAARRERLKSSQSSQEGKELPSPSVPGAKPVPAKRERLISQDSIHSAKSGPAPIEDKDPEKEKEKEAEIARLMAGLRPKDNLQLLPESLEESVRV